MIGENILVYIISYKSLIDYKPLRIRFDKIDRFIRVFDGSRYLASLWNKKYDSIYDRIRYLISVKSGITSIKNKNSSYYLLSQFEIKIKTLNTVIYF